MVIILFKLEIKQAETNQKTEDSIYCQNHGRVKTVCIKYTISSRKHLVQRLLTRYPIVARRVCPAGCRPSARASKGILHTSPVAAKAGCLYSRYFFVARAWPSAHESMAVCKIICTLQGRLIKHAQQEHIVNVRTRDTGKQENSGKREKIYFAQSHRKYNKM